MSGRLIVVRQPIDLGDGKCHPRSRAGGWNSMLRPAVFYWHAGRLYVGYGWLSSFHPNEEPVWDPKPVPQNAVVETCKGYCHFSNVQRETELYSPKYAELSMYHIHKTKDGPTDIREKIVLPPNHYLEYQWDGGSGGSEQILNRMWRDPKKIVPAIRKAPSLDAMRFSPEAKRLYSEYIEDARCIHGLLPEI